MIDTRQDRNKAFWNFLFSLVFAALVFLTAKFLYTADKLSATIPVFDFILIGIAVFRLTHLFVYDYITGYIREFFERFSKGPGKTISNLLSCPWCTGVWMALAVSFFYFLTPYAWYAIFILALAGVGTFIDIVAERIMKENH